MKASDLFVRCLEAEGVERLYGVPGEENATRQMAISWRGPLGPNPLNQNSSCGTGTGAAGSQDLEADAHRDSSTIETLANGVLVGDPQENTRVTSWRMNGSSTQTETTRSPVLALLSTSCPSFSL